MLVLEEVKKLDTAAKFRAALAAFLGTAVANDKEETLNAYLAVKPETLANYAASVNDKAKEYFVNLFGAQKFLHFGTLKAGTNPPAGFTPVAFNFNEYFAVAKQGASVGSSVEFVSKNRRGEDTVRYAVPSTVVSNDGKNFVKSTEHKLAVNVLGLKKVKKNDGTHSSFTTSVTNKKAFYYEVLGLMSNGKTCDSVMTGNDAGMLVHSEMLVQQLAYLGLSKAQFLAFQTNDEDLLPLNVYAQASFSTAKAKESMYLDRSPQAVAFALANDTALLENGNAAAFYNAVDSSVFDGINDIASKSAFASEELAYNKARANEILRDSNNANATDLMKQAREIAAQDGMSLLDAMQIVKAMREALAIA